MTGIAAKAVATKFQIGAAACAVAAAATLVPMTAHAAPAVEAPIAPVTQVIDQVPQAVGLASLPEFNLWWFGTPNPNPPPRIRLLSFNIPLLTPVLGWFGLLNKEICVGGLGAKIGPYGRISVSLGAGC